MKSSSRISLVIPAYNAAPHIAGVIARISQDLWPQIDSTWIINDGSIDQTRIIVDRLAQQYGAIKPIHLPNNKGYGSAVQIGLKQCHHERCDYAVCLHADGQYPAELISEFIQHMESWDYDILQGSRIASGTALSGGMPFYKFVAGKILTFLENRVFRLSLTDYHSGYLLYSRRALETVPFWRLSTSFDFDLEVIASGRAKGLAITELPIPTHYGLEKSYLNPLNYGFRVLGVMIKYMNNMYRRPA